MTRITKSVKAIKTTGRASKKAAKKVTRKNTKVHYHAPKPDRYCKDCDHEFRRPREYIRHRTQTLRHNPLGARKFFCDLCTKSYTQPYNLDSHRRAHFGETVTCNLPKNSNHTEICQKMFTDRNNLRAHIRLRHLAKFDTVPAWLKNAVEQRLNQIRAKPKPCGSTKGSRESIRETLSPFDSPLTTPSPQLSHSVQIFDAETMQSLQPKPVATENQVLDNQPGEFDIKLLDSLDASLPFSKGTLYPEYPTIASALPNVPQLISPSLSNTNINFVVPVSQPYEYPGTPPQETLMETGPALYLDQPRTLSRDNYCSYASSGAFPWLPKDQLIFDLAVTSSPYHVDVLGNMGQDQPNLHNTAYPFNANDTLGEFQHDYWAGYAPAFGTSACHW